LKFTARIEISDKIISHQNWNFPPK